MTRPTWESTFLDLAETVSARSTCIRARTGCVLVDQWNQVISTGYNGSPSGLPHCLDLGCTMVHGHCVRAVHAEQNAVCQAAKRGVSTAAATAYCTHEPCLVCGKLLIQAGILRIVYTIAYGPSEEQEVIRSMYRELFIKAGKHGT
jgi:dCMP deaminase